MILKVLALGISAVYGGVCVLASVAGLMAGGSTIGCVIMLIGGALLIAANFKPLRDKAFIVLIPLGITHAAAFINGLSQGGINVSHHLVRLVISVLIFTLFFMRNKKQAM